MLRAVPPIVLLLLGLAACGGDVAPPKALPPVSEGMPPQDGPWGEEVGGLVLGLDVPQDAYRPDDPMVFGARARHGGVDALRLHFFDDNTWHYHVTFENVGEGPDFWGGSGLFIEFAEPPDVTLKPGESWARSADLTSERRRFLRIIENRKPGDDWDYRDRLPAGRYRVHLEYGPKIGDRAGYWKGVVRTNEVEMTVTE